MRSLQLGVPKREDVWDEAAAEMTKAQIGLVCEASGIISAGVEGRTCGREGVISEGTAVVV